MDYAAPPLPPQAPQFDAVTRTWTLSRYADVQAVLRDPTFDQVSLEGKITFVAGAPNHVRLRADSQVDVDRMCTVRMNAEMAETARTLMNQAASKQPVNLLAEVLDPWATRTVLSLCMDGCSQPDPVLEERLTRISNLLFYKREKDPAGWARRIFGKHLSTRWYKGRRKKADAYLGELIAQGRIKITKSMYLGGSHTLPSFLAKAWLALLEHPEQMSKLRNEPKLMAGAVEELLRFAGPVHTLHRGATRAVEVGGAAIAKDDHILLKLESANRDPLKFDCPDRLDVTRRPSGNLGLGTGAHSCIGAAVIRIGAGVITPIFLAADPVLDAGMPIRWTGDSSVRWPLVVPARINRQ